jgi:hypothetical protein
MKISRRKLLWAGFGIILTPCLELAKPKFRIIPDDTKEFSGIEFDQLEVNQYLFLKSDLKHDTEDVPLMQKLSERHAYVFCKDEVVFIPLNKKVCRINRSLEELAENDERVDDYKKKFALRDRAKKLIS